MFETLFTYSRVLRRHREGPLAQERAAYLAVLAAHSVAPATLLKQARCCLRVAVELERWPADHCFDIDEVGDMASRYSAQCRASSSRYPSTGRKSSIAGNSLSDRTKAQSTDPSWNQGKSELTSQKTYVALNQSFKNTS